MTISRRRFLTGLIALPVAPAIVRAESIMRVRPVVVPGMDFAQLNEIGRNIDITKMKGAILKHATPRMILNLTKPYRSAIAGDTVEFRRWPSFV